jgi:endonuclease/exonuclease/phosphatase family metal-dependent hydrolase
VHPAAPSGQDRLPAWWADLASEPRPDPNEPPRILIGDFNATLDHAALRRLISHGYRDAADATGSGLIGTWGPYLNRRIPAVTIDHVLVDHRIGVRDVEVRGIPRTDHRTVLATLTIPAA